MRGALRQSDPAPRAALGTAIEQIDKELAAGLA